jgi:hypothetical protein
VSVALLSASLRCPGWQLLVFVGASLAFLAKYMNQLRSMCNIKPWHSKEFEACMLSPPGALKLGEHTSLYASNSTCLNTSLFTCVPYLQGLGHHQATMCLQVMSVRSPGKVLFEAAVQVVGSSLSVGPKQPLPGGTTATPDTFTLPR